jgi:hypothetical protein
MRHFVVALLVVSGSSAASAQVLDCTKNNDPATNGPFGEGYCAVIHRKDIEGWVRTRASLDQATGVLTVTMKLSTDSNAAGPCGRMTVTVRDAAGKDLASIKSQDKVCIPGKGPDTNFRARDKIVTAQHQLPDATAKAAKSIVVTSNFDGTDNRFWGIDLGDVIKIVVALF